MARQSNDPRPRDDKDVAQDTARDLAEIAAHIGHLQGDANAYLTDPNYNTLRLRLENAHAAVEARGKGTTRAILQTLGGLDDHAYPDQDSFIASSS